MFKILRALSWPVSTSALLTKFTLFAKLSAEVTCLVVSHARRFFSTSPILSGSCIDADLRILQWRFACNGKATSFIPFFWNPYAGLYTDHFSDSYSGPKCDSIAIILLVPSESRTKHSESTNYSTLQDLPRQLSDSETRDNVHSHIYRCRVDLQKPMQQYLRNLGSCNVLSS